MNLASKLKLHKQIDCEEQVGMALVRYKLCNAEKKVDEMILAGGERGPDCRNAIENQDNDQESKKPKKSKRTGSRAGG